MQQNNQHTTTTKERRRRKEIDHYYYYHMQVVKTGVGTCDHVVHSQWCMELSTTGWDDKLRKKRNYRQTTTITHLRTRRLDTTEVPQTSTRDSSHNWHLVKYLRSRNPISYITYYNK